jgi:hypothetical protein
VLLYKDQDYGIAMLFGLKSGNFNPVNGFDFTGYTITINSKATNLAIRNFTPDSWEGIRQTILDVPLSHPFWRMDKDLGYKPWVGL